MQKTQYTFDVFVSEFFCLLIAGASLLIAVPDADKDPERLVELIEQYGVTTLHFVPSMLGAFLGASDFSKCIFLRRIICKREALGFDLQKYFHERSNAQLYNLYGPTEASINVTGWLCDGDQLENSIPIGRPVRNKTLFVTPRLMPVAGFTKEALKEWAAKNLAPTYHVVSVGLWCFEAVVLTSAVDERHVVGSTGRQSVKRVEFAGLTRC